jgi:hypothetical protein
MIFQPRTGGGIPDLSLTRVKSLGGALNRKRAGAKLDHRSLNQQAPGRPEGVPRTDGLPRTEPLPSPTPLAVLKELFDLLEEYAPLWYTQELHERAQAALSNYQKTA